MKRVKYAISAVFDTETCNLGQTADTAHAIPILYIDNDIRNIDLTEYEPDKDDFVSFFRYEDEYIDRLTDYIKWGRVTKQVPIVCAYNLMFDLQSLMEELSHRYDIDVNAQSSTNVYTLDLLSKDTGKVVLRFWDTFHLDMRGLSKMGEIAGLPKAVGDWDYSLIRTPETELTDLELYYAKRDVQVIPMFLRFLLRTNDWLKPEFLGNRVLTKTSLVRQMAKHDIGRLKITKSNGKSITVEKMFLETCKQEMPKTYNSYALRKACFRGGYTFTAARYASTLQENVVSVDVTSMHHTFINGRMLPDKFSYTDNNAMRRICNNILSTTREEVIEHYEKPFYFAIHARIKFKNIRLRRGSAFEYYGIGLCPMSKFKHMNEELEDMSKYIAEESIIENGWYDRFTNATFAFGKLYRADSIVVHINEVELWAMSRVYDWDSYEVIYGESTASFVIPPDYVTLQSNMLYRLKDDNKFIANHYVEGEPYQYHIPDALPDAFKVGLRDGTLHWTDFNAYYISDTKGKFNGIYGTMAQDVYKPSYKCVGGEISVDSQTVVTRDNWKEKKKETSRVLYTYGMRIVAGSRLHMVLAIERVYETFGVAARVLGGDTDSMKISFDSNITDSEIKDSLTIFESTSKKAIDATMRRVRKLYPKLASSLRGVGGFEIENEGNHYVKHIELWNKCRCSIDAKSDVHITCAGLSRPQERYHIERFIRDFIINGNDAGFVLEMCVGYNVFVCSRLCHALEGHKPLATHKFIGNVTDHKGKTVAVNAHEVTCLYPIGRWLGETLKKDNANTIEFLRREYGRKIETRTRQLFVDKNAGTIEVCINTDDGLITILGGESQWLKEHQDITTGTKR